MKSNLAIFSYFSQQTKSFYIFIFALVCCLLFTNIFFIQTSFAADDKAQARKELAELKKTINSIQKELEANRSQQTESEKAIKAIDIELAKASSALKSTQNQLKKEQQQLSNLQTEQKEKNQLKTTQRKYLAAQLKSAYMSGQQQYVKLLLNQEDPAKVSQMMQYYKYLNKARMDDIEALQLTLLRLQEIETEIQSGLLKLETLQAEQKQQAGEQQKLKTEQAKVLTALKKDYQDTNKRLTQLRRDEQALQKVINTIEKKLQEFAPKQSLNGLAKLKKKLSRPVNGKILNRFGSNKFENKLKWNGVIIDAKEGTTVHAIHHGQVVFSDWLRGFGLVTILDHGKGYLSLYGQNQSLMKNPGDWVEAGEPIATSGQSGGGNSGLYFEIRFKGKPQNPTQWIR